MFISNYHILKAKAKADVAEMFNSCISQLSTKEPVVRLSVFWAPNDNCCYENDKKLMLAAIAQKFETNHPAVSFIAQKPLDTAMAVEVVQVTDNKELKIDYLDYHGLHYVKASTSNYSELHISGLSASLQLPVRTQSHDIFNTLSAILEKEEMSINSIVRQWNYIERITDMDGKYQRYQLFNDERTSFYEKTDWPKGYPAATGIGTQFGGIIVDCIAVSGQFKELPLANPLQTDAHVYTQDVLIGAEDEVRKIKTTPKFERAKFIGNDNCAAIYVSGTAAIRGEESLGIGQPAEQTDVTLENIAQLMKHQNLSEIFDVESKPEILRVYIKQAEDFDTIQQACLKHHADIPVSYLLSNICRDELLVEIEAVASCSI
ncbi:MULTISPECIES: hypothetical protein [unclassified Carboxylicivirga]|uniref:chorismate transformation enzyme, FkbO/Hyg5 family n=1 Tax=Carboxylicivirga TaxID=1628153 RepID=UPI003D34D0C4